MNTGDEICRSKNGLLSTIAIGLNGKVHYALEGSVFVGGAVVQWLRDELRFIDDSGDCEYFAKKVKDNGGVYVVPRLYRARCAPLGYVRPRDHRGDHPRHHPQPHHPRLGGVHRLPVQGSAGCDDQRQPASR